MCDKCLEFKKSLSHEDENGIIWTRPVGIICKHNQPERSKREDLDKIINNVKEIRRFTLEHKESPNKYGDFYRSILLDCLDYIIESEMRCSEHCGNTVSDK